MDTRRWLLEVSAFPRILLPVAPCVRSGWVLTILKQEHAEMTHSNPGAGRGLPAQVRGWDQILAAELTQLQGVASVSLRPPAGQLPWKVGTEGKR